MILIKTKIFEDYILDSINLHCIAFKDQVIPFYEEMSEEKFNYILNNITEEEFYYIDDSVTDKIILTNRKKNNRKKFSDIKHLIEGTRLNIINISNYLELAKDKIIDTESAWEDQDILEELLNSEKLTGALLILKVLRKFGKI